MTLAQPITVLLAEDDAIVRQGIRALLKPLPIVPEQSAGSKGNQ